jgi:hypothetical protein
MTNVELYGNLPKISTIVRMRRMRFAGHCFTADNQPIHHLDFKDTGKGTTPTYVQAIREDIVKN